MANPTFECPCAKHIVINDSNIPDWHTSSDVVNDDNVFFVPPEGVDAFEEKLEEIFGE